MIHIRKSYVTLAALTGVAVIFTTALTGCWDRKEIETLGFVTAVGIDEATELGQILVTVQVAKPASISRSTDGSASQEKAFWVAESTGATIQEALRNLNAVSPRRIYIPHARLILFGEKLARNGVARVLDWFDRNPEARRLMQVVVARGTARDMMQAEFELEPLAAEGLERVEMNAHARLSAVPEASLNDFLQALEREGMDPIGISAEIIVKKPDPSISGELKREEIRSSPVMTGTAVFKDDKLVGWLEPHETRGFNWLMSKAKGSIIVIEQPGTGDGETRFASIDILRASRKMEVRISPEHNGQSSSRAGTGRISFTITLEAEGNLGEVQGFMEPMENPELWTEMERLMAQCILRDARLVLDEAQELGADIFGLGAELYRKHPKLWETVKSAWDDEFPLLDVRIEVKAKLRTPGLTIRPVKIR